MSCVGGYSNQCMEKYWFCSRKGFCASVPLNLGLLTRFLWSHHLTAFKYTNYKNSDITHFSCDKLVYKIIMLHNSPHLINGVKEFIKILMGWAGIGTRRTADTYARVGWAFCLWCIRKLIIESVPESPPCRPVHVLHDSGTGNTYEWDGVVYSPSRCYCLSDC